MHKVLIAYRQFPDVIVEQGILDAVDAQVVWLHGLDNAEAQAELPTADALMVSIEIVSAAEIARMNQCRIVARVGAGLDAIDVPAATARNIWVTNVPDYSVDEVSSHVMALLLACARRVPWLVESTRRGEWDGTFIRPFPRLKSQVLGIVGFGRIARATAAKGLGLGLKVVAYDPYVAAGEMRVAGVKPVDLDTLLATSDFISLHVPLTNDTRRMMNADSLSKMKPTAYLINTARGPLVDEDALLAALQNKQIAGAALDVLTVEPPLPDNPLLNDPRALVTPHVAWYSEDANYDVRARAAEDVVRALRGDSPRYAVNRVLETQPPRGPYRANTHS